MESGGGADEVKVAAVRLGARPQPPISAYGLFTKDFSRGITRFGENLACGHAKFFWSRLALEEQEAYQRRYEELMVRYEADMRKWIALGGGCNKRESNARWCPAFPELPKRRRWNQLPSQDHQPGAALLPRGFVRGARGAFMRENRLRVKARVGANGAAVIKELDRMWKEDVSQSEKEEYERKAQADKAQRLLEVEAYNMMMAAAREEDELLAKQVQERAEEKKRMLLMEDRSQAQLEQLLAVFEAETSEGEDEPSSEWTDASSVDVQSDKRPVKKEKEQQKEASSESQHESTMTKEQLMAIFEAETSEDELL